MITLYEYTVTQENTSVSEVASYEQWWILAMLNALNISPDGLLWASIVKGGEITYMVEYVIVGDFESFLDPTDPTFVVKLHNEIAN
eukprot:UN10749